MAVVEVPGNDIQEAILWPGTATVWKKSNASKMLFQGWPLIYAWRQPDWPPAPGATEFAAIWNPFDFVEEFLGWAFAVDLAIAAAGVALVVTIFEIRRRRSLRPQFRLRTLLTVTTLVAVALGWWNFVRAKSEQCRVHVEELFDAPPDEDGIGKWSGRKVLISRLPLWVRSLIGEERALALGFNGPYVSTAHWYPAVHEHVKYLVQNYPPRVEVIVQREPTAEGWQSLAELTNVEVFNFWNIEPSSFERLTTFPRLRALSFSFHHSPDSEKAEIAAMLAVLPRLTSLKYVQFHLETDLRSRGRTNTLEMLQRAMPNCKVVFSP